LLVSRASRVNVYGSLLVASVTWSLLYSRSSMGAEIIWHELIALWVLAQALILGLALALLIFDLE